MSKPKFTYGGIQQLHEPNFTQFRVSEIGTFKHDKQAVSKMILLSCYLKLLN